MYKKLTGQSMEESHWSILISALLRNMKLAAGELQKDLRGG
jgi:hypothetical protein